MRAQEYDIAVVGASLAGAFAALQCNAIGLSVISLGYARDSGCLESIYEIPATTLNGDPLCGPAFAELYRSISRDRGIHDGGMAESAAWRDAWKLTAVDGREHVARRLVFAPFGSEVGVPELHSDEWLGIGGSNDAWSDADWFAGRHVVVLGRGARATEQALIALDRGVSAVTLLSPGSLDELGPHRDRLLRHAGARVRAGECARELKSGSDGKLSAVVIEGIGGREELPMDGMFLAMGLKADWGGISRESLPVDGRQGSLLVPIGLAAGVPEYQHASHVASGQHCAT